MSESNHGEHAASAQSLPAPSSTANDSITDLREVAHGIALRARNTAWLLGAGASAESGVPTAGQLTDELLLELYARDSDLTVDQARAEPGWLARVRTTYDGRHGLPRLNDPGIYSAVFEKVFRERDLRARFIQEKLDGRHPHLGHHILAALIATELAPLTVTTNFDTLIEDATYPMIRTAGTNRLTVLSPDNAGRVPHTLAVDQRPQLVKIHGDMGSVTLSNTSSELAGHDARLRDLVRTQLSRYGLIVVGYSGRDDAVMSMLREVLAGPSPFPAGLTWVRRPEDTLVQPVAELLAAARDAGVHPVREVVASGFGHLMTDIHRATRLPSPVSTYLNGLRPPPIRKPVPMPSAPTRKYPQIRFAALEMITMPARARLLEVPSRLALPEVRAALRKARARATVGLIDGRWLAFGSDGDLNGALAPLGVRVTADSRELAVEGSSATVGLLTEALTHAIGRRPGLTAVLRSNQRHQVRVSDARPDKAGPTRISSAISNAVGGPVRGTLSGPAGKLPWAEAITLSLEYLDGRWWLQFAPDIWVRPRIIVDDRRDGSGELVSDREEATRMGNEFTRERLARRYTRQTGAILGAWLPELTGATLVAFGIGEREGIDASFNVLPTPLKSFEAVGRPLPVNGPQS